MKHLKNLLGIGLTTVFLAGCTPQAGEESTPKEAPKPVYVEGIIKSEKYKNKLLDPDVYHFTLINEEGFKTVSCYGNTSAPKMDGLIDPGDKIILKNPRERYGNENDYSIELENIVEINGTEFNHR